ncbi:MAG: hypothetical protein HeimC2_33230 [Candidatus Heimdallarchaeota archaeon LC_2]|nr:MAG: hypothetical protein HeimC2_35020 [Candidatus Heimdallarchaeota archaeon LC_2]OLS21491.1 MAG: hypothetical protein HeimC2_33230 [Candidatus Heimdallarchaeota archaeon LC_2]
MSMSFMNLLWFKSSKKKAAEIGQYSLGRPFCKKGKLTKNIKIGIFHLTEQGPMVMYKDFEELKGITLTQVQLTLHGLLIMERR